MSSAEENGIDCVQCMRQTRDEIDTAITGMDFDGLMRWLRTYQYKDPNLGRLAKKVKQPGAVAEGTADYAPHDEHKGT